MATSVQQRQRDCRNLKISTAADEYDDENLEEIVSRQWRLHWVTPLRGLQYTEARLKQYARYLERELHLEESVAHVEASFTPLPGLTRDGNSAVPLKIFVEVLSSANEKKISYTGIMLSWTKSHRREQQNLMNLPLLLCRGGMKMVEVIHNMLHNLFDCSIKELTLEKDHMSWMLGLAAHFHAAESGDLHLRFNCPGIESLSAADCTIQMAVVKHLWRSILGPDTRHITYDEVIDLREKCCTMLQDTYGVKFSKLHLTRINCKDFTVSVKGHIKFSRELVEVLLKFVHDIGYLQESITEKLLRTERGT